jgi:anthranilate phosphoribosyltransferase
MLNKVLAGESLTATEAAGVMEGILRSEFPAEQIGAILIALRMKEESVDEIVGFARALRAQAVRVPARTQGLVDLCGTGGDASGTFNVSTVAAFVVAGAGQPVAKHGNRSVSSRSGSFDVLEKVGVEAVADPEAAAARIDGEGLGFLFAPAFHPAMKNVAALRKNLGVTTVFNLLGPLLNPAGVRRQVIGVYSEKVMPRIAAALAALEAEEAFVVRGEDGLDEISICAPTRILHLKGGVTRELRVAPEDLGLRRATRADVLGGEPERNAEILISILDGEQGARRDLVLLNAAAALVVGGCAEDLRDGLERARRSIDSGAARAKLELSRRKHAAA